jgi:hypothetical protein
MKQSKPPFPWHYDPKFLQFAQGLLNLSLPKIQDKSFLTKDKWDVMVSKYRAYYKLIGRLQFADGSFCTHRNGETQVIIEPVLELGSYYCELPETAEEIEAVS